MAMTRKQRRTAETATMCDRLAGGVSESGKQLRAGNRKVEARKRAQFKRTSAPNAELMGRPLADGPA